MHALTYSLPLTIITTTIFVSSHTLDINTMRYVGTGVCIKYFLDAKIFQKTTHEFMHCIFYIFTGCLKKLSFTELSICRFATNIISISAQLAAGSPNAQFGKTQFFRHPVDIWTNSCLIEELYQ